MQTHGSRRPKNGNTHSLLSLSHTARNMASIASSLLACSAAVRKRVEKLTIRDAALRTRGLQHVHRTCATCGFPRHVP